MNAAQPKKNFPGQNFSINPAFLKQIQAISYPLATHYQAAITVQYAAEHTMIQETNHAIINIQLAEFIVTITKCMLYVLAKIAPGLINYIIISLH